MVKKRLIFGLLRRIENESVRRETLTLVDYLKVGTVEDLAKYSRKKLEVIDVTPQTISALEGILREQYQLQFSDIDETVNQRQGYDVEDHGDHLIVKSIIIDLPRGGRAMSKGEIIDLYTRASRGEEIKNIAKVIGRSIHCVYGYLRKLEKPSHPRNPRDIPSESTRSRRVASGAPPTSVLENVPYLPGMGKYV